MLSMLSFIASPLRSTVTALLRTYLSKFVVGIRTFDDSVDSGDIVLRNLALRTDVIQNALKALPVTVLSATVQELHISIPWTALLSKAISLTLKQVNIVIMVDEARMRDTAGGVADESAAAASGPAAVAAGDATVGGGGGHSASGFSSDDGGAKAARGKPGRQDDSALISWLESYTGQLLCNVELHVDGLTCTVIFGETPVELSLGRLSVVSGRPAGGSGEITSST